MNHATVLPYGHAYCMRCGAVFNLQAAEPTFIQPLRSLDSLIFILCEKDHNNFINGTSAVKEEIRSSCFRSLLNSCHPKHGVRAFLAVIPKLSYLWHQGNLVDAYELGTNLSPEEYARLSAADYHITHLPGGMRLVEPKAGL